MSKRKWEKVSPGRLDEILQRMTEEALGEEEKKLQLILGALEVMEVSLKEWSVTPSHMDYSPDFLAFYALPWEQGAREELELFVSPQEDGYTYRCWIDPPAYLRREPSVTLYRENGEVLEVLQEEGWESVGGEALDGLFEEDQELEEAEEGTEEGSEEGVEEGEEELSFSAADFRDEFLDEMDMADVYVYQMKDLLEELFQDGEDYLKGLGKEIVRRELCREKMEWFLRSRVGMVGLPGELEVYKYFTKDQKSYLVSLCIQEEDEPEDGMLFGSIQEEAGGEKHWFSKVYLVPVD